MNKDKDILHFIDAKKTSKDFSSKVMSDIFALEDAKELSLSKILKENSLQISTEDFTSSVLEKIKAQQEVFKPVTIFSLFQKILIVFTMVSLLILSWLSKGTSKVLLNKHFKLFFRCEI